MNTPGQIGPIHYNLPRATKIREPGNHDVIHSVVHSAISVHVDSVVETHAILAGWPIIMQAAADKAAEIINAVKVSPE